jgi:integrase
VSGVHTDPKTGEVKFASLHDLRRTFGTRWAKRVKTPVLMRLMRHESITTTMGYYVDLDCDEIAEDLWQSSAVSVPLAPSGEDGGGRRNDTTLY